MPMIDLLSLLALVGLFAWFWGQRNRDPVPPPATAERGLRISRPVWGDTAAAPPPPPAYRPGPMLHAVREPPRLMTDRTDAILDGFTGAPLDLSRPLWRCSRCSACYEDASRDALVAEQGGRCLTCNEPALARFTASPRPAPRIAVAVASAHRDGPVTLTLPVCWIGPAAEPGFFVALLENKRWKEALKLIFPPAVSRRPEGARLIASLAGRRITVSGMLTTAGPLGPRIVVTDPANVRVLP